MNNIAFKGIYIPDGYKPFIESKDGITEGKLWLVVTGNDREKFEPFGLTEDGEIQFHLTNADGKDKIEFRTSLKTGEYTPVDKRDQMNSLKKVREALNSVTSSPGSFCSRFFVGIFIKDFLRKEFYSNQQAK